MGNWPLQLWKTLSIQRIDDIFKSESPSIVAVKHDQGEIVAQAMVTVFLTDLLSNYNLIRPMSLEQTVSCVNTIMDKYYYWKPEDFKYCFDNVLFGRYGRDYKVFDRIDIATVLSWCELHDKDRMEKAMEINSKNHEDFKNQKSLVVNEKILDVFKKAIPVVDKYIPIMRPMKPKKEMSPFELELVKHFDAFDICHKQEPAEEPGDIDSMILIDGKKMNAPDYVRMMIEKTTGKVL